jgi:DNA modification methylase
MTKPASSREARSTTIVKRKRSLTHQGGEVEAKGGSVLVEALVRALRVEGAPEPSRGEEPSEDADRVDVHGFHTYPARMHPQTARELVGAFTPRRGIVLDPFCGSGTVLLEASALGLAAHGTDLNPLAVELARTKLQRYAPEDLDAVRAEAARIAAFADDRRKQRAGATRRLEEVDVELFDPHVLLELDSLRAGIAQSEAAPAVRRALGLVLSAILVKVSRKKSDTSRALEAKRIAAGFTAKLFRRKAEELAERAEAYRGRREGKARWRVELDDATRLASVRDASVGLVVSSPPYAATYDYWAHHALRLRWLGLDGRGFARGEFGARRHYDRLTIVEARDRWQRDLHALLRSLARVTADQASVCLQFADSAVAGEPLFADEELRAAVARAPFVWLAEASQVRPHFHGPTARAFEARPRREHVFLLRRVG